MNTETKPYFADIKVGDKAWTTSLGDCECVALIESSVFPVMLSNSQDERAIYTLDGKNFPTDAHQSAFWQKPDIIDKGRPLDLKTWWVERYILFGIGVNKRTLAYSSKNLAEDSMNLTKGCGHHSFGIEEIQATTKEEAEEIAMEMPWKCKVKKKVERWLTLYPSGNLGSVVWDSVEEALDSQEDLKAIKLIGEYEVEEEA